MNINYDKLEKKNWFEDLEGNEIIYDEDEVGSSFINKNFKNGEVFIYKSCFPLRVCEEIDEYCYHPEHPLIKYLCKKSKRFYKWIAKGKERTFKRILTGNSSYGSKWSQECIVAMVNSGDFTLEQAVWVYTNSCERCMNVLLHKYLNGKYGYEEYSEEWKKCGTQCSFCESEGE